MMYQSVQEYLSAERLMAERRQAEEAALQAECAAQEKRKIMIHENLVQKVYGEGPSAEYPSFDSEQKKYYKLELLPVTDEEFAEVKRLYLAKTNMPETEKAGQVDDEKTDKFVLYNHVGNAVKIVAIIAFVIFTLASFIIGAVVLRSIGMLGLLVMFGGVLLSWVACVLVFAFGQMVENSDKIAENSDKLVALKQQENSKE